jgi:hypothetical protein
VGTTVTPAVGALTLTGQAPTIVGYQYDHTLAYRLVVDTDGTFTPGDPDPLADTLFWITSRLEQYYHPWIAQAGDGPNVGPDISIGGQKLELPLGRTADGEVQIRVIDVAAPIAGVACDVNASLVDEGYAGLDATTYQPTGDWTIVPPQGGTGPQNWWAQSVSEPYISGFALFSWFPYDGGPWERESYITRAFDGTESGGAAFVDGQKVGLRVRTNWTLNTGNSSIFIEANGVRVMGLSPSFDFWNIPEDALNNQVDSVVWTTAVGFPASVTVKLGWSGSPSCNVFCYFNDLQFVECVDSITGVDEERYVTGWLADADARQQLLGRAAYLEESTNGGATWSRVLYTGYLKQLQLDASLTYLLTLGDAGRGRRNSPAWTDLDPTTDFVP